MKSAQPDPGIALAMNSSFLGCPGHAGFLNALEAQGIVPGKLAGASAGAIVAGLRGAGLSGERLRDACVCRRTRTVYLEWHRLFILPLILAQVPGFCGIASARKAVEYFRGLTGGIDLTECPNHEVALAVTNLTKRQCEVKTSGPLGNLIVASSAFPGLIDTIEIEGERYWDGGIGNVTPFDHWLDDPAVHTIILHQMIGDAAEKWPSRFNLLQGFSLAHLAISDELERHRMRAVEASGKTLRVVTTRCRTPRLWSDRDAEDCYRLGMETGGGFQ